jgi:methyl-accepting chemotaxis protein
MNQDTLAYSAPSTENSDVLEFLHSICAEKIILAKKLEGSFPEGSLENLINTLLKNVEQILIDVRTANSKVAARGINLEDDIQMIQEQLGNYVHEATTIASATEQMAATVKEINTFSSDVLSASSKMKGFAETGNRVVGEAEVIMGGVSENVKSSVEEIRTLKASAEEISVSAKMIIKIASQTNLLALNATIEAARAGEHGKGFAVVANEVKKLSQDTAEATNQITQVIANIQEQTLKVAESMNASLNKVEEGSQSISSVNNSLQTILTESCEIEEMVEQITTATEQHKEATEESAASVNNFLAGITETSDRIKNDTNVAIGETIQAAQNVDALFGSVVLDDKALIQIAIGDHLLWLERIQNMLQGKISLSPKPALKDHTKCRLGKWYFNEDHSKIAENLSSKEIFAEIDFPHKRVHEIFFEIIEAYNQKADHKVRSLTRELDTVSKEIVGKLENLLSTL